MTQLSFDPTQRLEEAASSGVTSVASWLFSKLLQPDVLVVLGIWRHRSDPDAGCRGDVAGPRQCIVGRLHGGRALKQGDLHGGRLFAYRDMSVRAVIGTMDGRRRTGPAVHRNGLGCTKNVWD